MNRDRIFMYPDDNFTSCFPPFGRRSTSNTGVFSMLYTKRENVNKKDIISSHIYFKGLKSFLHSILFTFKFRMKSSSKKSAPYIQSTRNDI